MPGSPSAAPRPPARPSIVQRCARALLGAAGWRVDVPWPSVPRCVIVVYPHTSNWDFVLGYLAKLAAALPVRWVGKHSLFRPPFGAVLRRMGGIPVDRRAPAGFVTQLGRELAEAPWMWLALAPEGTRARTDHWKSGFYRLALAARVPIGLAFIDYGTRTIGLSRYLELTGDEVTDLERIRAAYAGKVGRHPDQASDIRLRPGAAP
jgi:1-acyl-sn-glycerol-3-phosphate acyltransferase